MKRLFLMLCLLMVSTARPDQTTGLPQLSGYISDIFGANIESWVIFNPVYTPLSSATKDSTVLSPTRKVYATNGYFKLPSIEPGRYSVEFPGLSRSICIMVPPNPWPAAWDFVTCAQICTNLPAVVITNYPGSPLYKAVINAVNPTGVTPSAKFRFHTDRSTNNPYISLSP